MNDLISFVMEHAAKQFGGKDGTFSAACFANALRSISQVNQLLDGKMVRALLVGRPDVKFLGGAHYRLVSIL